MISQQEAIERAEKELEGTRIPFKDRQVNVSLQQVYVVIYSPSPDLAAGDFIVVIDATTGKPLGMRLER